MRTLHISAFGKVICPVLGTDSICGFREGLVRLEISELESSHTDT